eukprot:TRINITY_DN1107_c0_g2_i3.p1 TRINITY_DN1107_c0_g2~~TRINITY_DN1107_c0_g2_i3.p1  ORF type:complete len:466 (-),score=76.51 TRINITY_DN1107_c0_g2_i3:958-2355(-)
MLLRLVRLLDGGECVAVGHYKEDGSTIWVPLLLADKKGVVGIETCRSVLAFLSEYKNHEFKRNVELVIKEFLSVNDNEKKKFFIEDEFLLPFQPLSLRDCSLFEEHNINAARQLVKAYLPFPVYWASWFYENILTLGRGTFPFFRPNSVWYKNPAHYMGNARAVYTEGETIPYPSYCSWMDYEVEIGIIVSKTLRNATIEQARDAIGGFVLLNDFSVRNCQLEEMLGSKLGVAKSKNFANGIGYLVATADEIIERFDKLSGRAFVNDKLWGEGKTKNIQHNIEEVLCYISMGETLSPGEVIGTGTIPNCCGLEKGKKLQEGDEIKIEVDGLGSLKNKIGKKEQLPPSAPQWKKPKASKLRSSNIGLISLLILLASFVIMYFTPCPITPHSFDFPPHQAFSYTQQRAPVYFIQQVDLFQNDTYAPEAFVKSRDGSFITGMRDGTIRRLWNFHSGTYEYISLFARVL